MKITDLGIFDILRILLATIAAFNLGAGCLLTIEKIFAKFGSKGTLWVSVYIIVTALGIVALKTILERS